MPLAPEIKPGSPRIVYHYCSSEAFYEIVHTGTVRFTDIGKLNDYAERRWASDILRECVEEHIRPNTDDLADDILQASEHFQEAFRALVACFSAKRDSLSQWRSYADNGAGFCIGISLKPMIRVGAEVFRVVYNPRVQRETIRREVAKMLKNYEKGRYKRDLDIDMDVYDLAKEFPLFKNYAFREEAEIRAIILTASWKSGETASQLYYTDFGGSEPYSDEKVDYLVRRGHIVPYKDFKLGPPFPLKKVILGPRNPNSIEEVGWFLNSRGFNKVKIERSGATFR